ncbi:RYamide receptor-like [Stylophora pistillata]|uniref:RYamide receptor-like n=1 Tax=Stylophora pistillata TaxID=50429 RepID=UPI000C03A862|nr:RYamide receptor-like [Stylophora pistillata]
MSFANHAFAESLSMFSDVLNGSRNWTNGSDAAVPRPQPVGNQMLVREPLVSTVFKVLALPVVIILSLVGNFLTICSVSQNINRRMRTSSNFFIVNLSVADLLVTVCNIPRIISILLVGYEWLIRGNFGVFLCKVTSSVPFVALLVSSLSFTFIALDRFLAVFFPLRRPITKKIMAGIIAFTWIFPCCCYSLLFHYATLVDINGKTYCANRIVRDLLKSQENYRTYLICDLILMTGIPIATTTVLYTAIGVKMCNRAAPGNQTADSVARNRRVNYKVISMLVAVLIAFCICWMPTWVALACLSTPPPRICYNDDFAYIRYFLSYSNSAVTPYIYPVFNQNFRQEYLHILRQIASGCCFRKIFQRFESNQVHPSEERTTATPASRIGRTHFNTTEL